MFVITVDQVDSRIESDAVAAAIPDIEHLLGDALVLAPERTAGDEFQFLVADSPAALAAILRLTRSGRWSVGCGVGPVRQPLPASIREASGDAFIAARDAVERAKGRPDRFALSAAPALAAATAPSATKENGDRGADAGGLEAIIDLLLIVRSRRSAEGWELWDLVTTGATQAAAATRLGISPQAASKRAQAGEFRAELAVTDVLATLLTELDTRTTKEQQS